jgi:MinD superfamily P-loop ATPase
VLEIVILSGKGGTGKTSLTAAFADLSSNHIMCDLDVDAPDLHLLLQPENISTEAFVAGHEAVIITEKCENCGQCMELCCFDAVFNSNSGFQINPLKCEGCNVCVALCPANAIDFPEKHCGDWYLSNTRFGPLVHAQLFPGEENSGKLVSLLRSEAKKLARKQNLSKILCDGPPGIGCPVISSLAGASLAVIVTEPTPSGYHDLERIAELCRHFRVPAGVIINKFDLNDHRCKEIAHYCHNQGLRMLGRLPHDPIITEAMIQGQTITEFSKGKFSGLLCDVWHEIEKMADLVKQAA